MIRVSTVYKTASGVVTTKPAGLVSMQIGMDGTNDPTITIYNGTDNSGVEVVPTNTYDASLLGLSGFEGATIKDCPNGIYLEITCAGDCEVILGIIPI